MTQATKAPLTDAQKLELLKKIADVILELITAHGDNGIPSGHLYARLMGNMSLDTYQAIIDSLKQAGKVKESYHVLTAVKK